MAGKPAAGRHCLYVPPKQKTGQKGGTNEGLIDNLNLTVLPSYL